MCVCVTVCVFFFVCFFFFLWGGGGGSSFQTLVRHVFAPTLYDHEPYFLFGYINLSCNQLGCICL